MPDGNSRNTLGNSLMSTMPFCINGLSGGRNGRPTRPTSQLHLIGPSEPPGLFARDPGKKTQLAGEAPAGLFTLAASNDVGNHA